ncbi:thermonuclease family protein [Frigoribacterium sp. 2-23]|uniref:thermonuclease family protein n=1 Tax=Frigoribacterium sp. 2-23 TaxID=3415006 RepID=UPI003C6F7D02
MTARRRRRRRSTRSTVLGLLGVLALAVVAIAFPQVFDRLSPGGSPTPVAIPTGVPAEAVAATVDRVVDGDTVIVVLDGGARERLRLIGVDTPETVKPNAPVDCFGPEASAFTTAHAAAGSTVWLESDSTQGDRDRYDRLLRYVWVDDGSLLNEQLIAGGFGREDTYDAAYRYRDAFVQAEKTAEAQRVGLWGACG